MLDQGTDGRLDEGLGNKIIPYHPFLFQYYTKEGIPTRQLESNVCAVCGCQLLVDVNVEGVLGMLLISTTSKQNNQVQC